MLSSADVTAAGCLRQYAEMMDLVVDSAHSGCNPAGRAPYTFVAMIHLARHTDHHSSDQLIHWACLYDLGHRLLGRRGNRLRKMLADDLELRPGDRVLDVGCGPGRLARVFAERVAPTGAVDGIDAAVEMINRASSQARKRRAAATFQVAFAQDLPFPDATFDAVGCALALHHVAQDDQPTAVEEMYRVLKPGGRLLIAEFHKGPGRRHAGPRWLRHSGEDMLDKALGFVQASGFIDVATGSTNLGWLGKITAHKPETSIEMES
jgi:ubiquinone/menaquinone biosynthesis C-methylase UbiE